MRLDVPWPIASSQSTRLSIEDVIIGPDPDEIQLAEENIEDTTFSRVRKKECSDNFQISTCEWRNQVSVFRYPSCGRGPRMIVALLDSCSCSYIVQYWDFSKMDHTGSQGPCNCNGTVDTAVIRICKTERCISHLCVHRKWHVEHDDVCWYWY